MTEAVGQDRLLVSIPDSPIRDAAELELDLYLRLWEVMMPLGRVHRVS